MKKLYPYQQIAYNDCKSFLFDNDSLDSGIAVLPTGAGKSVILAHISMLATDKDPILFVVPSIDLLRQNAKAIEDEGGEVGIYCGSINSREIKNITVASVMSLKNDSKAFIDAGIKRMIVDECHYKASETGVFKDFIDVLKPIKLLGLTATAFKLMSLNGFQVLRTLDKLKPNLFKRFIHITQVNTVIENKRWSEIKYLYYEYDTSKLEVNTNGTEYTLSSIEKSNKTQNINNKICAFIRNLVKEKKPDAKILLFTDTVETAEIINKWINEKLPTKSAIVTAKTSQKERKESVEDFKTFNSGINILINYGTFTTGFDYPELEYVIFGRSTMSFASYYQIVGRLTRKHENKEKGVFVDFCGTFKRFGGIENISYIFLEGYGWCVFSRDKLMTGIPLEGSEKYTYDYLTQKRQFKKVNKEITMPFGKFKGKKLTQLPIWYRSFLLNKFEWSINNESKTIVDELKKMRDNDEIRLKEMCKK